MALSKEEAVHPLIEIENDKCEICYACVRACPVTAIKVTASHEYPEVVPERCIGCGSCILACTPEAIKYRSSIEETKEILKNNRQVAAIVSPGIAAEFNDITDYRKFVQMIRELGFVYVNEASFGVDLVAYKFRELTQDFKGRYYIASNDPVVVFYVEKYKPTLINNLTPIVSPMVASARVLKQQYGDDLKIIYIGPDIASKDEALRYDEVNSVLTFVELRQLFDEFRINESNLEYSDFDPPLGYKGSLYPISNGFVQAADLDENLLNRIVLTVEGKKEMVEALDEFETNIDQIQRHLNVFYGNSLTGPGTSKRDSQLFMEALVIKYSNKRLKNFFRFEWNKNLQSFQTIELSRDFIKNDQRLKEPSEKKIQEILSGLHPNVEDNIGCEECGYASCRDLAIAISQGLATPEMCTTHALQNTKNYIKSLRSANEEVNYLKNKLEQAEKLVDTEQHAAQSVSELMSFMLQKLRAGIVIVDDKLKVVQTNAAFLKIIGEEAEEINEVVPGLVNADLKRLLPYSIHNLFDFVLRNNEEVDGRDLQLGDAVVNISIFPIQKGKIVGGIIRDMSAPEVQKAEVMKRVTDTIDKNLELVQKIGFLLGEGASEIEKELNSIIEFYKKEQK